MISSKPLELNLNDKEAGVERGSTSLLNLRMPTQVIKVEIENISAPPLTPQAIAVTPPHLIQDANRLLKIRANRNIQEKYRGVEAGVQLKQSHLSLQLQFRLYQQIR